MTEIGIFTASYNRNTKKLYTSFSSTIKTINNEVVNCVKCDDDLLNKKVKELVSQWFSQVNKVEESDIAINPIKTEIIQQEFFTGTGELKYQKIRVYQD